MINNKHFMQTFKCEIWIKSIKLKNLKLWIKLLYFNPEYLGLSPLVKRFTLLRSSFGNKKSKDQYERREYRYYLLFKSSNPSVVLAFIDSIKDTIGINIRIIVSSSGS